MTSSPEPDPPPGSAADRPPDPPTDPPPGSNPALTPDLLRDIRADLEAQLAKLEKSMSVTEEAVRPVELDQQAVGRLSRMDSLQNQQMSQNLQERERARHAAIQAALRRIEEGSYGRCTSCGSALHPGRLMVMPEVEHCSDCST
ncbi:MAG: TraR/DksA family transcriptional regulator [Gemmatimonadales bacterium]|nr:MAG: TraR/DksA family transcriptional regulator [Gemmatimonadales bacterium]